MTPALDIGAGAAGFSLATVLLIESMGADPMAAAGGSVVSAVAIGAVLVIRDWLRGRREAAAQRAQVDAAEAAAEPGLVEAASALVEQLRGELQAHREETAAKLRLADERHRGCRERVARTEGLVSKAHERIAVLEGAVIARDEIIAELRGMAARRAADLAVLSHREAEERRARGDDDTGVHAYERVRRRCQSDAEITATSDDTRPETPTARTLGRMTREIPAPRGAKEDR